MGSTMKNLSLTIKGVCVGDTWLRMILADIPETFTRDDLLSRMAAQPWPDLVLKEAIRPILQHLKRQGVISYCRNRKCWQKTLITEEAPNSTLPIELDSSFSSSRPNVPDNEVSGKHWLVLSAAWFVSACLVGALMIINAGFAWNLAGASIFRLAFTIGFMGLDGLRPLLMALALGSACMSRPVRALALIIALGLAPASVISSTSVISSALILGTEAQTEQAGIQRQLASLHAQLERLESRVSQVWNDYRDECDRGGCGEVANGLKADALDMEAQIKAVRDQLGRLETNREGSTFASRTIETLQFFGLHGKDLKWLMPVFLALTLEIAALFGPALLLGIQRPGFKVVSGRIRQQST